VCFIHLGQQLDIAACEVTGETVPLVMSFLDLAVLVVFATKRVTCVRLSPVILAT
jgi:hypothetical protein